MRAAPTTRAGAALLLAFLGALPRMFKLSSLAILLIIVWAALSPSVVRAHAELRDAAPRPNTILRETPSRVVLTFNEPVTPALSRVDIWDRLHRAVGRDSQVSQDNKVVTVNSKPLDPGVYTVDWTAFTPSDGHTVKGFFVFTIAVPKTEGEMGGIQERESSAIEPPAAAQQPVDVAVGESSESQAQMPAQDGSFPSLAIILFRWLSLIALAASVGSVLVRRVVVPRRLESTALSQQTAPVRQSLDHYLAIVVTVGVVAALVADSVGLLLRAIGNSGPERLWATLPAILATNYGALWITRQLLLVLFLGLVWIRPSRERAGGASIEVDPPTSGFHLGLPVLSWQQAMILPARWDMGVILALMVLLTFSLSSHSASLQTGGWAAVGADWLHLTAAIFWAGGMVYFAQVTPRAIKLLDPSVGRSLSREMATYFGYGVWASIILLATTGIALSIVHVSTPKALIDSPYGAILLLKQPVAVAMVAIHILLVRERKEMARLASRLSPQQLQVRRNLSMRLRTLHFIVALALLLVIATLVEQARPAAYYAAQGGSVAESTLGLPTELPTAAPSPTSTPKPTSTSTSMPTPVPVAVFEKAADGYSVRLEVSPGKAGNNRLDVVMSDSKGLPVEEGRVTILYSNLEHGLFGDVITTTAVGGGRYRAEAVPIGVLGQWEVRIIATIPGGDPILLSFSVPITE